MLPFVHLLYETGEENFLIILDTERSLIAIQDEVIQSQTKNSAKQM